MTHKEFVPAPDIDINGTCQMGYVRRPITAERLAELFGQSQGAGDKVQYEWAFADSAGNVVTLYDWKNDYGLSATVPYLWHVGAHDEHVAERFIAWLDTLS